MSETVKMASRPGLTVLVYYIFAVHVQGYSPLNQEAMARRSESRPHTYKVFFQVKKENKKIKLSCMLQSGQFPCRICYDATTI